MRGAFANGVQPCIRFRCIISPRVPSRKYIMHFKTYSQVERYIILYELGTQCYRNYAVVLTFILLSLRRRNSKIHKLIIEF